MFPLGPHRDLATLVCQRADRYVDIQKSNDPQDLLPPEQRTDASGAGLEAFNTPGPYIPSQELTQNIEQPKVREVCRLPKSYC